jgi:carboxyl-terminal processing protease
MYKRLKLIVAVVSLWLVALVVAGAALEKNAARDAPYRQLAVYTEVLSRIKSDYVEEPNLANVTLGAVNGLLESIDPFASYLNAKQYQEYLKHRDTPHAGVGLILSRKYGYLGMVSAIPGSPAAQAGLSTGDMLEAISGVSTRDMPLAYADLLLQGQAGSSVEISVLTVRQPEPKKLTLVRAMVHYPPVTHRLLEEQFGYVRAESLLSGGATQVAAALQELQKRNARGIILDLRRCSTGTPEDGLALANLFVDKGLLAYLQGQRVARRNFEADPSKTVSRLPMVVITNRGTAAGAEIAAAALLDRKRADIVGERTYGDAALRQAITMGDGSAIILSVAKYHSPNGKAIQDSGVTPTVTLMESEPIVEVEEEAPPERPEPAPAARPGEDHLLKKAIEMLGEKIRKTAP